MHRLSAQLLRFKTEPFKLLRVAMSSPSSSSGTNQNVSKDPGFFMKTTIKTIGLKFPSVQNISTSELSSWLANPEERAIVILDCRENEEYVISHIDGSIHVGYDKHKALEELIELCETRFQEKQNPTIVCYCSVGYRSSDMAQKLTKFYEKSGQHTRPDIFNLHGSLFKWAQERRPMVDQDNKPTPYVHPYSSTFGKLVDKELRREKL